jgi:hypothetical protein
LEAGWAAMLPRGFESLAFRRAAVLSRDRGHVGPENGLMYAAHRAAEEHLAFDLGLRCPRTTTQGELSMKKLLSVSFLAAALSVAPLAASAQSTPPADKPAPTEDEKAKDKSKDKSKAKDDAKSKDKAKGKETPEAPADTDKAKEKPAEPTK